MRRTSDLFAEAEQEQNEKGDDSELHIIILDELDAICKQRGTRGDSTGVGDTVVNQLLSKIDGVNALNNILVIGMTNRLDMLDEALLRPGRLEVQIEIGLPDEPGRVQILNIHTKKMRENKLLNSDVNIEEIAKRTKNFSGAELEGLVISATSFAMKDNFDMEKYKPKNDTIVVKKVHFEQALKEMKPSFGIDNNENIPTIPQPLYEYSNQQMKVREMLRDSVKQLQSSRVTNKMCVLIGGQHGSGKTTYAFEAAKKSGFPFIKVINAEMIVGFPDSMKCNKIAKVFNDSYKSNESIIVIDDLERILEYTAFGPRFDNTSLHLLLSYIKKQVPNGKKLFIVATTCLAPSVLQTLDIWDAFTQHVHCPIISGSKQFEVLAKDAGMDNYFSDEEWTDMNLSLETKSIAINNALLLLENYKEKKYDSKEFRMLLNAYCNNEKDPWADEDL